MVVFFRVAVRYKRLLTSCCGWGSPEFTSRPLTSTAPALRIFEYWYSSIFSFGILRTAAPTSIINWFSFSARILPVKLWPSFRTTLSAQESAQVHNRRKAQTHLWLIFLSIYHS